MREIIFRGKRVDNGKWVEGCYVNHLTRMLCPIGDFLKEGDEKHYIVKSGFADWNMPRDLEFVEVIPETVGQYTGLKDKNGKMIFEGDIFSLGDKNILYVVEWCDTGLKGKQTGSTSWVGLEHWQDRIEIIGNIHDNPELLT